jgi:hypothetical protein
MARPSPALLAAQAEITALKTRIAELETQVATRDARLVVATTVFKDQRSHIRELEAKLNTRGVVATTPAARIIAPIITRYTDRFGRTFEKTRISNKAVTREITIN